MSFKDVIHHAMPTIHNPLQHDYITHNPLHHAMPTIHNPLQHDYINHNPLHHATHQCGGGASRPLPTPPFDIHCHQSTAPFTMTTLPTPPFTMQRMNVEGAPGAPTGDIIQVL